MKPWHEIVLDFLVGTYTKGQLSQAGALPNTLKNSVTTSMELGSGYDSLAEENNKRQEIVNFMRSQVGKPYVLGAEAVPGHEEDSQSWDCSEETEAAYRRVGMLLPDGAQQQFDFTQKIIVPKGGDLGFLWSDKRGMIGHVMCHSGQGSVIHAVGGRGVVEDPLAMWEMHTRWRGWRVHPDFSRPKENRV